jgi:hypothetical protein
MLSARKKPKDKKNPDGKKFIYVIDSWDALRTIEDETE